jgi:hypothetical protein
MPSTSRVLDDNTSESAEEVDVAIDTLALLLLEPLVFFSVNGIEFIESSDGCVEDLLGRARISSC